MHRSHIERRNCAKNKLWRVLTEVRALLLLILDKLVRCTILTLSAAPGLKIDSGVYLLKSKMMMKMKIKIKKYR